MEKTMGTILNELALASGFYNVRYPLHKEVYMGETFEFTHLEKVNSLQIKLIRDYGNASVYIKGCQISKNNSMEAKHQYMNNLIEKLDVAYRKALEKKSAGK